MGAFYNSICIPGKHPREVRESLSRWLHARGFELSAQPMLFDLDGEAERSAFVLWNDRWTVVVFSKYEEERRLIRELQSWAAPILYVWVQDSDVWGYDVFDRDGYAGSFNSDPRSYVSFGDDPGGVERPEVAAEELCELIDRGEEAAELRRIHRQRAVFKEDVCLEFCRWLGAEGAFLGYDELERGTFELADGWRCEQLLFFHRGALAPPRVGTGLHDIQLSELESGVALRPRRVDMSPELLAEVEQMRRRARLRLLLLTPVSWLATGWQWLRERLAGPRPEHKPAAPPVVEEPAGEAPAAAGGRRLRNERHGCRITLAEGAVAEPVSGKPASVFAFRVGRTEVTCTSRRLWKIADVLRPPSSSRIVRDEKLEIGGLEARHLLFELPPLFMARSPGPSFLGLHVIRTFQALYVFLYRFPEKVDPEVEAKIRETVSSFRLS